MNGDSKPSPVEPETGQPIEVLMEQEHGTSSDFIQRVRRKIHRRTTTAQLVSYSWHLPKVILIEMTNLLNHFFSAIAKKER